MTRRAVAVAVAAVMASGLAAVGLPIGPTPTAAAVTLTPDRGCAWPIIYPGTANYAYPDTNAAYFVTAAILGPRDRITIKGIDPKARYWSMQTYRFSDSTLLDAVNDASVRRTGTTKKWTIQVVHSSQANSRNPNILKGAGEFDGVNFGSNLTVIMMRVYVSATKSASGGALPTVTLRSGTGSNATVRTLKTCRGEQITPPDNRPALEPAEGASDRFVRAGAERFYPSADAVYLGAQQAYDPDSILVVSAKAPRVPQDVRYWSLCQNVNEGDLPVVDCLRDSQVGLDQRGYFRIAVVDSSQIPRSEWAAYPDVDFLRWSTATAGPLPDAFLIFRNLLPRKGFAGSVARVPVEAFADEHIGEYAPVITMMSRAEFDAAYRTGT